MTSRVLLCRVIVAFCIVTLPALAADKSSAKRFVVDARGSLELQVPTGWSAVVRKRADYTILEIVFGSARGGSFEVSLTPSWGAKSIDPTLRERAMRESVSRLIDAVKNHAVESELRAVKFDGVNGSGLYFSATDKAPRAIDYKYLTQGAMQVGDLAIDFTILTRDGQEQVVKDAIAMLKSAKLRQKS